MKKNERLKNRPVGHFIKSEMRDYTTKGLIGSLRENGTAIRAFLVAVFLCVFVGGCKTPYYVPIESNTEVHVKDSTILHIKDSIRYHEATRYKDMAWLGDTLKIEGSRSSAWAFADTTRECLTGGLEEKPYEERSKIIYKYRWKVRDSLVYKEVPVEVEKPVEVIKIPWIMKFLSAVGLLSIIGIALWVFLKVKGFNLKK